MFSAPKSRIVLIAGSALLAAATGVSLASVPSAGAAPVSAKPAAATAVTAVTHANTLTADVKRLVKGSGTDAEAKALSSYWTTARMRSAVSLETATIKGARPATVAAAPQGSFGRVAGAAPTVTPRATQKPVARPAYDNPNLPYYHPTARTVGKVYFTRVYGSSTYYFVCSGAIVNTEGKSTVWTAGHCVYDFANGKTGARVWDSNFAFVPSYSNGSRPYGTWYARNMTTMNAWINNRDFSQDNGAAFINRNYGYRIADYLGSQGLMWNASANYYANAYGYPAEYPFNGETLWHAYGYTYATGSYLYMYSGLTGGSSGGPWLRNYDGSYGSINGHNDFVYDSSPAWMYTPYYGNQVATLYNTVRYQSA